MFRYLRKIESGPKYILNIALQRMGEEITASTLQQPVTTYETTNLWCMPQFKVWWEESLHLPIVELPIQENHMHSSYIKWSILEWTELNEAYLLSMKTNNLSSGVHNCTAKDSSKQVNCEKMRRRSRHRGTTMSYWRWTLSLIVCSHVCGTMFGKKHREQLWTREVKSQKLYIWLMFAQD